METVPHRAWLRKLGFPMLQSATEPRKSSQAPQGSLGVLRVTRVHVAHAGIGGLGRRRRGGKYMPNAILALEKERRIYSLVFLERSHGW